MENEKKPIDITLIRTLLIWQAMRGNERARGEITLGDLDGLSHSDTFTEFIQENWDELVSRGEQT
jgi:hypothetical protein